MARCSLLTLACLSAAASTPTQCSSKHEDDADHDGFFGLGSCDNDGGGGSG